MQLGAVFPQTEIGPDRGGVRAFVQAVEELRYQHLLAFDHVLGADGARHPDLVGPYRTEHEFHEILVLFGFVAGIAPGLELATGVVIAPQRQTALLAKQAAELDLLTQGHFRLGLGIGWNPVEYEALAMDFHDRGRRFEEQIDLLRRLWQEPVLDYEGRWHRVTAAGLNPLPVQRPIPIWIGASAEPALRRAARLGDGFFPQGPAARWAQTLERMRDWRREAGGDPDTLGIEARISVADGTPDDWRAAVDEWRALGATHVSLVTMGGGLDGPDGHVRRLEEAREALAS